MHRIADYPDRVNLRTPWTLLILAVLAGIPSLVFRLGGIELDTYPEVAISGLAILSAAFLISSGAEASQYDIPAALSVALVAFIAVLPEYAVDLLLAYEAGQYASDPVAFAGFSEKANLALANMTGANRLLLGVGWATVIFLFAWKAAGPRELIKSTARHAWRDLRGHPNDGTEPELTLPRGIALDVGILVVATLYSFIIVAKGRIALEDTILLGVLFLWYVIRLARAPVHEPDLEGPAEAIGRLPVWPRRAAVLFFIVYSAIVIGLAAEPFVHGLEYVGRDVGIGEFFVIQWIAPLASESPEFLAALYLVWRGSAGMGVNMLISSKVNQWTLLIASVPIAYIAGGGALSGITSSDTQVAEVFITAAQSVFGVMLIIDRQLTARAGFALLGVFLAQLISQFFFQENNLIRWIFGVIYLGCAAAMLPSHWQLFPPTLREAFQRPGAIPEEGTHV
ncbi:MAG: sodium:calcium antiporter [Chloroflexi bacterium]|nr:sodium:calcium antiporter [Chloroflexota bacterium]